jgi:hypothetical protein
MRALSHALCVVALIALLCSSACQPETPAPPSAVSQPIPPTVATPPDMPQPNPTPAPPALAAPTTPPQAPKATSTPLPFLPTSTVDTLPADQASTVRAAHAALAGSDYSRAIALLEPLLDTLGDD